MKYIKTIDAVGHVLCHDITRIVPGEFKGAAFKKGHIVKEEDIEELLSLGKEHLYVWENDESMMHEDEGAYALAKLCLGENISIKGAPKEGKIEIVAETDGLLKVDDERLRKVNSMGDMIIASRHGNFPVKKGDIIAAMRVIPLVIKREKIENAKIVCGCEPLFDVLEFKHKKAAVIVTGSEVAKGRIKDSFGAVVEAKLAEYGAEVIEKRIVTDDTEAIADAVCKAAENGAHLILCTGGMSVDPDDRTPGAIRSIGADILTYGAPVLPGAMFMLAYYEFDGRNVPVMGLPGCVMYAGRTVFDLILPRVLADDKPDGIADYGQGGLCLNCDVCTFPNCGFGK